MFINAWDKYCLVKMNVSGTSEQLVTLVTFDV